MSRKLHRMGAAAVAATLLLTGCVSNAPTETAKPTGSADPTTPAAPAEISGPLKVWVGSWWEPKIPEITEAWKADYPNVPISFELNPSAGYFDKFTSTMVAGQAPDVVDMDINWVSSAASKGMLRPLDEIMSDLPADDYAPGAWDAGIYDGVLYAVPTRSENQVWYYNKTVFDTAGVAYPEASWTYAQMAEMAAKTTIPGKQWGFGLSADPNEPSNVFSGFAPMLWAHGGDFFNEDNSKSVINSKESVAGIQFWADLYLDGSAPEGSPGYSTTRDITPLMQENKVGMMVSGSQAYQALGDTPGLEWGIVLAPDGGINRQGGWTMTMPTGSTNPDAGAVFIKWFHEPEHLAAFMTNFPARNSANALPPWNDPKFDLFKEAAPFSRHLPAVAGWTEMQTVILNELQKVLVKQSTAQDAADRMAQELDRILAEALADAEPAK